MKRIFASVNWTRVIGVLAAIFIVWSITLIISVKRQQAEIAREAVVISKLNGIVQSIFALEKSLKTVGLDSSARWPILYNDYRTRRAEFDPGDPNFRDLQVNLIRTDSLLIRIGRLHVDWRRAETDLALQKSLEADFYREINVATMEVQNAMQIMRQRSSRISIAMADNGYALFGLVLVACALAAAVTWLLRLLQQDMLKIQEADTVLRTGEERLRQIFEHAPLGMAMSTLEGKFIQVNPAFGKLLGYTEAELLRRQTAEICHPDDLAMQHKLMNRLQRGEIATVQLEKRYLNKKQQTIYTLVQTSLIREADGAAPRLIEQVIDVTERQQEEFARRQSEERFREMVENIDEVFWLTDPAKNEVFYVNTAYEKIWSRSAQSLYETPQTWLDGIHPEDRERIRKAALTKQVIGQYDETYRIQRPDGETRWVRDRAFPIRDEQGSVYRIAGLAEDITERKQAEAAVHGSEQRWSLAIEGSDAGVWDWEVRANKVFYSHRWKAMLGYQEHEIGDSLDECYSRVHPEDLPVMVGALEKHLRGETPIYISEHRKRCKDGRYKLVQDRGKVVLRTAEGKPLRVVSIHIDISEPGQAKAEPGLTDSRLKAVVENLQFGILCEDKTRHVVYTNQKFCDMFGIPVAPAACTGMGGRVAAEQAKNIFVDQESFVPRIEEILKAQIQVMNEELRLHDGRIFERDYIPIFVGDEYWGHLWHYREVTAIKQAAEGLRKSEEQFRLAFEVAPVGMTISGIDGSLMQCNRAFCEMLGYTAAELQGKTWIDITHPNDTSTNIAFRERLLRGDISDFQIQKRYLAKNGQVVYAQLHMTLIKDKQGRPLHFVSQTINLTALKEARGELSKQSATFQSIVEIMADGVVVVDTAGKFLVFNLAAEKILGVGATETSPQDWAEKYGLYLPDQITPFPFEQNPIARAMQGEVASAADMFVRNAQRPRGVWLSITATPLRDKDGNAMGGIVVFRDVTAQKQAEEALRKNEEQFRLTFEHAPIGMAISSIDGAILQVNQAYCDILGRSVEELVDHSMMEFTHPDDTAENMDLTRKLLHGEIPHYQIEKRYLAKDGRIVHVILESSLLRDANGNPAYLIDQAVDISGRKQAEAEIHQRNAKLEQRVIAQTKEVQESEERYRTLVERMPDGIYRSTPDGRFVEVNPAMYQMFGYTNKDEFLALDASTQLYFHPDERNGAVPNLKKIEEGIAITRYRHKDGHEMWVEDHGRFICDEQGKVIYNEGILRDITARKTAEAALQANEERLRRQNEALRDLVSSPAFQKGNLQEVYREITATVARSMNVARVSIWFYEEARTKIVCRNLYELNSDRHSKGLELLRHDFLPYFEALAEGRHIDAQDAQTDYRTRCFAEIYLKPLGITSRLDAPIRVGGNVIGVVCHEHIGPARHWTLDEEVFASSIADLAALAIESRQLEESETRFRTLIETMNDGLVQLDEKGLLIYVNDKMCEMTGFSREQMLGREVLPRLDTESRDILHDQIERRQTGESKPYEMEIRINGPGKLPVRVSPQPIFNFDGRFSGSFAVVTDISDRKRMEEQIRQHAEELERLVEERAQRIRLLEQQRAESEKLAATGRMSARIAHEINNPLAGIKNSFLLVKDGIPTTHRYYDYVRRIETEIERIARIVRQMFDLYRPQQDSVRSFPADLAIRDVVALLRINCRERDITIDVDINTPNLNVALSEGALRQVLYNVIQNAVDASSPGGTVRVRAAAEQQQLIVNVIDQGQGIPEEIRPQIFEPFFTTKSGLEHSGLGLGLSVSKGLVEAMGGKLDFESTVGKGTTFMITLPLDAMHHKALATVAPPTTVKNLE